MAAPIPCSTFMRMRHRRGCPAVAAGVAAAVGVVRSLPRPRPSGRSRRRPTSSRATSRTSRSTATAASSSARRPRSSPKPPRRSCGRSLAGADGTLWAGSGNEGKVLQDRARRQGHHVLRRRRARSARARAGAGRRPLRRDVARRQDLPGRRRRHVEDVLRSRRQVHLGARGRSRRQRSSPPPATRASSTRSRPTARARSSTRPTPPTSCRSRSTQTGELLAGTESPGRVFRIDAAGKAFVLLDSPYREIHALQGGRRRHDLRRRRERATQPAERSTGPTRPPRAAAAAGRRRLDRDHRDHRRRRQSSSSITPVDRPAPSRRADRGAIYRIRAGRPVGHRLGDRRGLAVRPADRAGRQPAGRHRHGGQDLPRRRRSGARDAAGARRGAAGHGAPARRRRGRIIGATSNPGKVFALSTDAAARGTYESDVRDAGTVATWGVIRWRATRGARAGRRSSRAPATPRRRTKPGARGRSPTPTPTASRSRSPNARYLQWSAVLSAEKATGADPDVGDRRLPAAQSAAGGGVDHRPPARRRVPAAVLDRRARDRRVRGQHLRRPPRPDPGQRPARRCRRPRRSAAGSIRRGCRRSSGRRRTTTTIACSTTSLYRREGETAWKAAEARRSGTRSSSGTRPRCPTAPTS